MADRRSARSRAIRLATLALAGSTSIVACGPGPERTLRIGSTTSMYDTGLLDALIPEFEAGHPGVRVDVFAVGSGEALELGRRGDVDLVIVHSPAAEERFLAEGHGRNRRAFARNDFLLAGPAADPAAVRGLGAADAFRRIAESGARFVSRGDDSGTHARERRIWDAAGVAPEWNGYEEVGQGMSAALLIAGERDAYALTDRATLVSLTGDVALVPLVEDDPLLENLYSVIEVVGAASPDDGRAFADWLLDPETLERLGRFGTERYGAPLFHPLPPDA